LKIHLLCESSKKPDEWFLKLIIALGGNIVVLKILLSVESDLLGFDFSVFNINLISDQDNWNVLANSHKIFVPLWNVLVGDS